MNGVRLLIRTFHWGIEGDQDPVAAFLFLVFKSYVSCLRLELFICVAPTCGCVFEYSSFFDIEQVIAHDSTA